MADAVDRLLEAFQARDLSALGNLSAEGISLDVNGEDDGLNVLMRAALSGDADTVSWILDAGAAVDARSTTPPTAEAAFDGMPGKDEDENTGDAEENDDLELGGGILTINASDGEDAVREGLDGMMSALMQGLDADGDGADGEVLAQTALMLAAMAGHQEVVERLLLAGADPNLEDADGATALVHAASSGHAKVVRRLVADGAEADREVGGGDMGITPLLLAAKRGDVGVVRALLDAGASTKARGIGGGPLLAAVKAGQEDVVGPLLGSGCDPDQKWMGGQTLLHLAIENGGTGIVHRLLLAGADPNGADMRMRTPLLAAIEAGEDECVAALLGHGADVDLRPKPEAGGALYALGGGGRTPLMAAAAAGRSALVRQLLMARAEVDARVETGETLGAVADVLKRRTEIGQALELEGEGGTALHFAAKGGHAEIVNLLVQAGAGLDVRDAAGETPIALAVRGGHSESTEILERSGASTEGLEAQRLIGAVKAGDVEVVRQLLAAGAEANAQDVAPRCKTPIVALAAQAGSLDILDALLAAEADVGALIESRDEPFDQTALHVAAEAGQSEAVARLLAAGADPKARDRTWEGASASAFHRAAEEGHVAVLEAMRPHLDSLDLRSGGGSTALSFAASEGHTDTVRALLGWGASPNDRRCPPLTEAAQEGHLEIVRALLEAGADPNLRGGEWSALAAAASGGHENIVAALLEAGANPAGHGEDMPPIECALSGGEVGDAIAHRLLDAGLDVNTPSGEDGSPLMSAVLYGRHRLARELLKRGADPNVGTLDDGETPLMRAAGNGALRMVEALLEAGAKIGAVDSEGKTALVHAIEDNQEETARRLIDAGTPLDLADEDGRTALSVARDQEVLPGLVTLLEERGAAAGRSGEEISEEHREEYRREQEAWKVSEARGIANQDSNDTQLLIKAPVEDVARAFQELRGAGIWQPDAYGEEVTLTNNCFVIFRFAGHPWTTVRVHHMHLLDWSAYLKTDDARALSEKLEVPAIFFANSDTACTISYGYYENGNKLESVFYGEESEDWDEDDDAEDWADDEDTVRFESERREVEPGEIEDAWEFVDALLISEDAYAPSWGGGYGREAGETQVLEIGGLEASDFERMDFVAIE